MLIRSFKSEDAKEIFQLIKNISQKGNLTAEALEQKLSRNYTRVIEDDNCRLIGYGSIYPDGTIEDLFVHKDFGKQGLGTLLLTELEYYARKAGIEKITVKCSQSSQELFKRLDYRPMPPVSKSNVINMVKTISV